MSNSLNDLVLAALRTVQDPDLKKDLVTLGMIRDLAVDAESGRVAFRIVLTTPACPLKAEIEREAREAVMKVPGVRSAEVKMDAETRRKPTAAAANGQAKGVNTISGVSHIIAVSSGKGGVGKSTVAVNLAMSLALEGARVGLLDADIYGPNVPTMMGVTEDPKLLKDPVRGEIFIPPTAQGIKVMSMGFLVHADQPVIWRGPMLHSVLNQFCFQVDWGQLDYLIIDMPPGTGDVQLSLAQLLPLTGAVMVSTPQEVALQDVRKAFGMWEKVRVPVLGVVENMAYFKCGKCDERHALFGEGGGRKLAQKYGTEVLAQLPLVPSVREGGDEGRPVVVREPASDVALAMRDLARKVAQKASVQAFGQAGLTTGSGAQVEIGAFAPVAPSN